MEVNTKILKKLKKKYKIEITYQKDISKEDFSGFDVVIHRKGVVDYPESLWIQYDYDEEKVPENLRYFGEIHYHWEVIKNTAGLTPDELALICDKGNLCFGYFMHKNSITICTD